MKAKDLKLALDAERKIIIRLMKHPEEFDKMPEKSVVLPRLNVEIPVKSWKEADTIIRRNSGRLKAAKNSRNGFQKGLKRNLLNGKLSKEKLIHPEKSK